MAGRPYFDIILQGGGRMVLAFKDSNISPDEVGALKRAYEEHIESGRPLALMVGVGEIRDNRPMNERVPTRIVTRDRSSQRYHYRYIEVQENGNERLLVDERCQTDQSGKYDVLDEIPESADRNTLCRFCFPGSESAGG